MWLSYLLIHRSESHGLQKSDSESSGISGTDSSFRGNKNSIETRRSGDQGRVFCLFQVSFMGYARTTALGGT